MNSEQKKLVLMYNKRAIIGGSCALCTVVLLNVLMNVESLYGVSAALVLALTIYAWIVLLAAIRDISKHRTISKECWTLTAKTVYYEKFSIIRPYKFLQEEAVVKTKHSTKYLVTLVPIEDGVKYTYVHVGQDYMIIWATQEALEDA